MEGAEAVEGAEAPAQTGPELIEFYECVMCHTLHGEGDEMGYEAPALEEVGKEHDAAWLEALLTDPGSVHPDTDMPSAEDLEMSDAHKSKIVAYLLELAGG